MESTDRRLRQRARWPAVGIATLMLLSMLPFAGSVGAVVQVPDHLAFNPEPGVTITGGVPFPTQPKVEVRDVVDAVVTSDNTTVITLAIKSGGTSGATLTCTGGNSKTVASGVAMFAGCAIDKAGTGYILTATSSPAYTFDDTAAFNVDVGPAATLVFQQQPAGPYDIAEAFAAANQPKVAITDAGGNVVAAGPDSTVSVTLSITPETPVVGGPGALACTTNPVAGVAGIAAFAGCKINTNSGGGYRLRASATLAAGARTADTAAFIVRSGTPVKLAFKGQPGNGTGGVALTNQPVVQVQDVASQVAAQDSTTVVTLAIASPSPVTGATLTCEGGLSKTVTNGQATFEGCKIDKAAVDYRLTATATLLLAPVTSNAFTIAVGPAVKLGFTAQPASGVASQAFAVQPIVAIQDAGGNTVTTALATTVNLVMGTNPSGGILTCTGANSKVTVSGVATFSGCAISTPGVGYTLAATATGLTNGTTAPFNVGAASAVLSLSASATNVNLNAQVTLTIQFASQGAGRQVTLQKKSALDLDWVTVTLLAADATGKATSQLTLSTSAQYRATYAGAADMSPGTSNAVTVGVRHSVVLQPRTPAAISTLARGTRKTYTATVRPITSGQRVSFLIYKRVGSAWVFQTSATVVCNASGRATFTWRWSRPGLWYVRARANTTPLNTTAFSNLERVRVP